MNILIQDLKHKAHCYYGNTSLPSVLRILLTDGTSAVVLYRMARFFQKLYLAPLGWLCLELNKFCNGCVIGRHTEFGPGLVLMHPVGVVINGGVTGGSRIVMESGVVIGAARNGVPVRVPALGDDIFIGAGAKVLGGIRVGSRVMIGANAVVLRDVPDDHTAVGIPAAARPRKHDKHDGTH